MARAASYVVVYDIEDDQERNRVDKLLKNYGFRVQKSVFECLLTKSGKERMLQQLSALKLQTGFVKTYRLQASHEPSVIGEGPVSIDNDYAFIL